MLEARGVGKRFPGVVALDDVSFTLRAGETHALVGENGAGKSTLIKVLTGVHRPDGGELLLSGRPVRFARPSEAQEAGISTIYQEVNLVPLMSVARNVFLGREPKNRLGLVDFARMHAEAAELLGGFGVTVDPRRALNTLGIGTQQMVALARAVSVEAHVVVMDEPTSPWSRARSRPSSASSATCAGATSPWCTSATAWTSCTGSATGSPSCATAGTSTPARSPNSTASGSCP